jgi:hypothetical protein
VLADWWLVVVVLVVPFVIQEKAEKAEAVVVSLDQSEKKRTRRAVAQRHAP